MQRYLYVLEFVEEGHREENQLFANNYADALSYFEGFYLTLHKGETAVPDFLALQSYPDREELLRYALHTDLVRGS